MINEPSKRRDNFDERNAAPVVLADGQEWYIPKPWLEIRPVFRKGRAVTVYRVLTCGPELDQLVDALADSEELDDQVTAVASLAAYLLNWHYALSDAELDALLCFRAADPTSLQWLRDVFAVATGRSGPKVGSGGDD